jgi:Uma2 family endonuclease
MGALPKLGGWTAEQFAAWAAVQDEHYEFDGNEPQMMTGPYWPHEKVVRNIQRSLEAQVAGTPYDVFGPLSLIRTVGEACRAPDVFIAPRIIGRPKIRILPSPIVAFEVVSGETQRDRDVDYKIKLAEYGHVPTMLRYVIVEPNEVGYALWSRERGDQPWTPTEFERAKPIPVPELGCVIPLEAVYAELDMVPPP